MRASYVKAMSRLMIGIIVIVLLSVMFNYLLTRHNRSRVVKKAPEILSAEMIRSVENIEYFDNQNGVLKFQIRAQRLLETRMGKSLLQGIEACDFNPDGSVRNEIRSREAEYDGEHKIADFSGDVRVFFGEGMELRTESLHYDSNSGIGETNDPLQLYSPEASGKARGMRFDQKNKNLELKSEVDFVVTQKRKRPDGGTDTEKLRVVSERASGSEMARQILLQGKSRVESGSAVVLGDRLVAILSPDEKRLNSLHAEGNASYQSKAPDEIRQLNGHVIVFDIGETSRALEKVCALQGADFSMLSPSAEESLNGAEICLEMDADKGLPKQIQSHTDVRFRMKRGSEQTLISGDQFTAIFAPGTKNLERVHVGKQAKMSVEGAADAAGQELEADEISMSFRQGDEKAAFERLLANGSTRWTLKPPQGKTAGRRDPARTLEAERLEMSYSGEGDFLESGNASGKVIMTEISSDKENRPQVRRLLADAAQFHFFPGGGRLRSMDAEGHVQVAYEKKTGATGISAVEKFQTESEKMRAVFDLKDGVSVVNTMSQWNGFRYRDGSRTVTAVQCEYNAQQETMVLEGSPKIISDEMGATTGDQMEYDRKQKLLLVHRRVRSKLAAKGEEGLFFGASSSSSPNIVTADELQYWMEAARARYAGNVQLLSENGQLHANSVEILRGGEQVDAQGEIVHIVPIGESSAGRQQAKNSKEARNSSDPPMIIKSSALRYLKKRNSIAYMGNVTLHSGDLDLSSGSLDAVLDETGKRIDRATAKGKVLIHHQNRECKGDTADYYLDLGKFVVVGNPAEIYDPEKGRSFARRLTSFTADDRILIEKQ